jgi:uncharacterized protein YeaO (DUF488 family)
MPVAIKRVYETPDAKDGQRILVDHIWPRGLTKEKAKIDLWLKEISPSTDLRKSFCHDPAKWDMFKKEYFKELDAKPQQLASLRELVKKGKLTLIYAAKDEEHNNALAMKEYLTKKGLI